MSYDLTSTTFWRDLPTHDLKLGDSSFYISKALVAQFKVERPTPRLLKPDVILYHQKERFYVSGYLLARISGTMRNLTRSNMRETLHQTMDLTHSVSLNTLKTISAFAYGHDFSVSEHEIRELLRGIDYFDIPAMDAQCPAKLSVLFNQLDGPDRINLAFEIKDQFFNLVCTRAWVIEQMRWRFELLLGCGKVNSSLSESEYIHKHLNLFFEFFSEHRGPLLVDLSNSAISNKQIRLLPKLPITHLSIENCSKLTNNVMERIAQFSLIDLRLSFNSELTSLKELAQLTTLRRLEISRCPKMETSGVVELVHLDLEKIDLSYNEWVENATLMCLSAMTNLSSLNVSGCSRLTGASLTVLKNLPLETLRASKIPFTVEDVHELLLFTNLQKLTMGIADGVPQVGSLLMRELPLVELDLSENSTAESLSSSMSLRRLCLDGCVLLPNEALKEMPLEKLSLAATSFTDEVFPLINKYSSLLELNLAQAVSLTDMTLCGLTTTSLRKLTLAHTSMTDKGIKALAKLVFLHTLDISDCSYVSDKSMAVLYRMSINHLKANRLTRLTSLGLERLTRSTSLRHLELINCPGIESDVSFSLEGMALEYLDVSDNVWVDEQVVSSVRKIATLKTLKLHNCFRPTEGIEGFTLPLLLGGGEQNAP